MINFKFVLLTLALFVSGCTKEEQEDPSLKELSKAEKEKLLAYKAEVELGRNMAGRLLQYYGTNGDQSLMGYVNQVGNYVASYGDYPDRRYMFALLDTDSINAFACPGGYILLTMGTMKMVRNEAELSMILGHEVAHVGKQHMIDTLRQMGEEKVKEEADNLNKKTQKDLSYSTRVRKRPSTDKSSTGAVVARYLSGSAGAGFSLLQAAKAGMNVILDKGLDPKLEHEADREGVKYAIRAGYEPFSMIDFLDRLEKRKKKLDMKVLGKTHPSGDERKKRIKKLLKSMKAKTIVGAKGVKRFKKYTSEIGEIKKK